MQIPSLSARKRSLIIFNMVICVLSLCVTHFPASAPKPLCLQFCGYYAANRRGKKWRMEGKRGENRLVQEGGMERSTYLKFSFLELFINSSGTFFFTRFSLRPSKPSHQVYLLKSFPVLHFRTVWLWFVQTHTAQGWRAAHALHWHQNRKARHGGHSPSLQSQVVSLLSRATGPAHCSSLPLLSSKHMGTTTSSLRLSVSPMPKF